MREHVCLTLLSPYQLLNLVCHNDVIVSFSIYNMLIARFKISILYKNALDFLLWDNLDNLNVPHRF